VPYKHTNILPYICMLNDKDALLKALLLTFPNENLRSCSVARYINVSRIEHILLERQRIRDLCHDHFPTVVGYTIELQNE